VIIAAEVAWPHRWIVYIGIILASSGSAIQQIQSAPYIISSIADDEMLPRIFNFLKGSYLRALSFTVILISISICFGSIDQAAPLVTIFFLLCYGGVNIACFLLDYLGSPNWRPKWRYYNKFTAFTGVVLCSASMVVISWWASIISIVGALLIYAYLDKKS
jgi:amino acid transporter